MIATRGSSLGAFMLSVLCACTSAADENKDEALALDASDARDADADAHIADAVQPAVALSFRKITLHREFYCEGAAIGDLDADGNADVIAGPHWYAGPNFTERHELWPAQLADIYGYSDC